MKLEEKQIAYFKNAFIKMKGKQDLLNLLNHAKKILYGNEVIAFELRHINYHSNPANNKYRYKNFTIAKKSGEPRTIYAPTAGLLKIQQCLNLIFQAIYEISDNATGFVAGKSIVDNAQIHNGKHYVFNIDLKDFFHSIDQARIWGRLQYPPFKLNKKRGNLELANIIASLCCHSIKVERLDSNGIYKTLNKNVLPQGAATSPVVSNIICEKLDYYLSRVANRFNLQYSRYADDITFSSMYNVFQENSAFRTELNRIIADQNFYIKESKVRLQKKEYRQEVTGLVVNVKPNVKRKYIKELRMWLYYWEHYGFERANKMYCVHCSQNVNKNKRLVPNIAYVIRGKLDFLKMIKGDEDETYKKLRSRYNKLIVTDTDYSATEMPLIEMKENSPIVNESFDLPIVHQPKDLITILKKFSLNKTVLKYATHSWDGGKDEEVFKDFEDFLVKLRKEFKQINELKKLNKHLWAKILSFLLNKNVGRDGWGYHRIKFGWSSPELLHKMRENSSQKPENIIIPLESQFFLLTKNGTQLIQKFQQVIDIFKNEIEIRDENSALEELILKYHDKHLEGFKILNASNLKNKNFYTDVYYFEKALDLAFDNIRKRSTYKNVSYILNEDDDSFTLNIIHHESYAIGRSITDQKLSSKYGDMGLMKSWLTNLCDWSIESHFKEGKYRINYLVSDNTTSAYEILEEIEGFKHIFKFFK